MRDIVFAALAAVSVAGCATTGRVEGIPAERLVCENEPGNPAGEDGVVSDEENSEYLRLLRRAWKTCWNDVEWIRDYIKGG